MRTKFKKLQLFLITGLCIFILAAGVMALTNPEIPRHFIGAGGKSTGGGYTLTGSAGQHDAGGTLTGGDYKLAGGFWGAGGASDFQVFIPLILK